MTETIRCPSCGAVNRAGADWCGQCLKRFTAPPPPPPPPPVQTVPEPSAQQERAPETSAPEAPAAQPAPETPGAEQVTRRGAFTVVGRKVTWTCARCETVNDISQTLCPVCGATLADTVRPDEPRIKERDPGTVAMYSLFFPGAGHAYLGLWGQAIARAVLSLWVVTVALYTAIQGGSSRVIAVIFALAAFALWAVAAHDAYREATSDSRSVILKPRMFLYVTLALLGLLFVLIVLAALAAQ
ncbi:MAG: DUF7577 domain-containing protein [Actinomycetota bacterium]